MEEKTYWSYTSNIIAGHQFASRGAKTPAAMLLLEYLWNISASIGHNKLVLFEQ